MTISWKQRFNDNDKRVSKYSVRNGAGIITNLILSRFCLQKKDEVTGHGSCQFDCKYNSITGNIKPLCSVIHLIMQRFRDFLAMSKRTCLK